MVSFLSLLGIEIFIAAHASVEKNERAVAVVGSLVYIGILDSPQLDGVAG
jgi:hypothetical protein